MGFKFKAKGINLAGSSAQESYGQKVMQSRIFFHQKYNFSPNPNSLFHWPYQTGTQNILGAGEGGGIVLLSLNHTLQRLSKGRHSIWHRLYVGLQPATGQLPHKSLARVFRFRYLLFQALIITFLTPQVIVLTASLLTSKQHWIG